jgi:peptide-methionine (R)-S-oxide reductase
MSRQTPISRRTFFATTGAAALSAGTARGARAATDGEAMVYEVTRTEAEWLEHLDPFTYFIMRKGGTEEPKSNPLWMEFSPGTYHCKGCELTVYDHSWKVPLDKGWVFFEHAVPDAVLMGIDGPVAEYGQMANSERSVVEVHCRRCGSHLGHYLILSGMMVHCINGAALEFRALEA